METVSLLWWKFYHDLFNPIRCQIMNVLCLFVGCFIAAETRIISVVFTLVARSHLQNGGALLHGDHWNVARSATLVMNFCKTLEHEHGKRPINASSTEKFQLISRENDEFEKCWEMLTTMGAKPVKL